MTDKTPKTNTVAALTETNIENCRTLQYEGSRRALLKHTVLCPHVGCHTDLGGDTASGVGFDRDRPRAQACISGPRIRPGRPVHKLIMAWSEREHSEVGMARSRHFIAQSRTEQSLEPSNVVEQFSTNKKSTKYITTQLFSNNQNNFLTKNGHLVMTRNVREATSKLWIELYRKVHCLIVPSSIFGNTPYSG